MSGFIKGFFFYLASVGHWSDILSLSRECFSPVYGFGNAPGHRGDVCLLNGEGLHPLTEVVDERQHAGVALVGLWEGAWSPHKDRQGGLVILW